MIDTFKILKTAYLAATRNQYTLEDDTKLPVFTNWANVGTDVSTYLLFDGLTDNGAMSKCGNDATSVVTAKICQSFTGNIDTDELYSIKSWLLNQPLTYDGAQIMTQRITSRELTDVQGSNKLVQIIITFNHFIKQF